MTCFTKHYGMVIGPVVLEGKVRSSLQGSCGGSIIDWFQRYLDIPPTTLRVGGTV
jgi:hypothetical protein